MKTRLRSAALLALFFVSGACGLGYQVAWTRLLGLGLGHEVPAVLGTVAAIFSGMALGAWAGDRWLRLPPPGGNWYGFLELLIGIWGLVSVALIPWGNRMALEWTGVEPAFGRQWLVVFIWPAVALLPATLAMGATFPIVERLLAPIARDGHCVAALYAANTFGAVIGVVLSTWILLPAAGFTVCLVVFSVASVTCGALALALVPRSTAAASSPVPERPGGEQPAFPVWSQARLAVVLVVTGLLGIGYEVLAVRVLAQVLEGTIYSFAALLAVYLCGTAMGAAVVQAISPRLGTKPVPRGWWIWPCAASLAGVLCLGQAPQIYESLHARLGAGLLALSLSEVATAGAVFLLPTMAMGATFSFLVQGARANGLGVGRAVALNTLGSALAPAGFGLALLPWLGPKWAFVLLAAGYLVLLTSFDRQQAVAALALLVLFWLLPADLRLVTPPAGTQVVHYSYGVMDSVAVLEHFDRNRSLLVNNRFAMGGTGAALAERRHATLPLLLHSNPRRALFLGLGTGISFAGAVPHLDLKADGVELLPEVVDAFPWFKPHNEFPRDGRFRVFVADARRFVRAQPVTYDVIVADLFHPARDGAGALYSLEHFRAVRERLAPDGLFCQWLPLYQLDESVLRTITRTFLEVFPGARAFLLRFNVDTPVLGLVGTIAPMTYRPDYFPKRVQDPELVRETSAEQLRDGFHLFGCFLAGPAELARFANGAAFNTDDRPVVLFDAPRFNAQLDPSPYGRLLGFLNAWPLNVEELVSTDVPLATRRQWIQDLSAFLSARNAYLRGLVAEAEGQSVLAVDRFVESARLSPLFTTGYAQCLSLAMQQAKTDPPGARRLLERLVEAQPSRPVAAELLERLSHR